MNRFSMHCIRLTGLILFASGLLPAQSERIDQLLQELDRVTSFSEPSISPDGQWVTWTQEEPNGAKQSYLQNRSESESKPISIAPPGERANGDSHAFAWSKDSAHLAFLSTAGSQNRIFVMSIAEHAYRKIADLNGYVRDVRWSPDGKQLAFLYAEGGGGGGPLEAEPAAVGEIGGEIHNQRLTVVDANESGSPKPLTPENLNIYEYDWAPDGNQFAVIAAPGPADNNWWIAKLYRFDITSADLKVILNPAKEQQIALPRWSPDGTRIALIAGLMSDEGFTGGDVLVVPAAEGGAGRDLTPGAKMSASWLMWQDDRNLILSEDVDGGSAITTLSVSTGQMKTLWQGPGLLHAEGNYPNLAFARDGHTVVAIQSNWEQPPEVWAGQIGNWQQVTRANSDQRPHWGKSESIHWTSGNFRVQGWLLYPQNFDPKQRYPMVVEVHGGPANQRSPAWPSSNFDMSVLSGMGYFVFFPNPRGSYGQGEAFTRANVKDFGGGDLRDILAGLDTVIAKVPVDRDRIGITGWSYGGFMTMWTVTQTHRFRAAVAGAGIADWLSYYGENSIDEWMIPYFGASVYDNPAVYAKSSPIDFIKNVKTPTLVLVGERDGECPAPQSFEFWHALETLKVPTKLVVYAGEGHGFHDQKDRLDRMRRTLAWFNEYLGAK
ncbi:MAG TPA: S9 family peptidase [Bryobacteraceae bacterium]|nr:S9 family peptidase [Bryobacteraceae bacterium]